MNRRLTTIAAACLVLVLLVFASLALAADADVTPPTTVDNYDGLWHNATVTVLLTATDDSSGVAGTYYSFDGSTWLAGTSFEIAATADHLADGEHVASYKSVDNAGNWETPKSCTVKIDTQLPTASITGNDALWHRQPVLLTLGGDDVGPAGLLGLQYKIDGRSWTSGTTATVKAPTTHSWDGTHKVYYRSRDNAGNLSASPAPYVTVKIDTKGPACSAPYAASGVRYGYATLKYRVNDARSSRADVTIKIKTLSGSTIKTLGLGSKYTNKLLSTKVQCTWAPKDYRFYVYANDLAGNKQSKVGVNTLTVKPQVLSGLSASVSDSTPAQYSDVTVKCRAKDQAGRSIKGVKCTFVWHYKTTTPKETRSTGSDGIARCTRNISGATAGYRVVVTITATYGGVTKTTSTSFVPH